MNAADLLPFALLGAVFGLDVVSFPQAMISRPLVAATVGGAVAGRPGAGLLAGAVLELCAMETLPVGASRYPEWGTASLVGGALYAAAPRSDVAALLLAVAAALATAWVGGWSMYALRRLNGFWAKRARDAIERGRAGAVVALQLRGLGADLLRGALLTVIALVVWRPIVRVLGAHWSLDHPATRGVLAAAAAAFAVSAVWRLAHGAPRARWTLLAGLAVGFVLLAAWR